MQRDFFRAFGLTIESSIDFYDYLPVCKNKADVVIIETDHVAVHNLLKTDLYRRGIAARISGYGNEVTLYWEGVGIFRMENGDKITYQNLGADLGTLRLFILSEVIAIILYQRNHLVLHGSAIRDKNGYATIFVGAAGSGKSTIAAALAKKGNTVLTDDLVAVGFKNGNPSVIPAFNQLKLWQNSIDGLAMERLRLQPSFEGSKKYLVKQSIENFPDYYIPIKKIWCSVAQEDICRSFSQSEAYMEILKNFALPGILLSNPAHFTQIVQVVKNIPVHSRPVHRSFEDMQDWIVQHAIGE
jgi:hypothetical protein